MSKIELITRRNCEACTIMLHNIADALDETTNDITLKVIHAESLSDKEIIDMNIKRFPTTIIKENNVEVARLEGTYTESYLIDVINKIN